MKYIFFWSMVCIGFISCQSTQVLTKTDSQFYELANSEISDEAIESMITPYKRELDDKMNEVIGYNESNLKKSQPEGGLGSFVCDAILNSAQKYTDQKIDFAVSNYGGLRIPNHAEGPITRGEIYELMPFDNGLVILELNAGKTQELLLHMAKNGGWPISEQAEILMNTDATNLHAVINGSPLHARNTYRILISDYVANGGDQCSFLIDEPREVLDLLFRDAIIEYVLDQQKNGVNIQQPKTGRFSYEK